MSLQSEKKRKREEQWEAMFARLAEYVRESGAAVFDGLAERDMELAKWVDAQRAARDSANLAKDKEERLSGLGFPWDAPPSVKKAPPPGVQPLKSVEEIEGLMLRREPSGHVPLGRRLSRRREAAAAANLPSTDDLLAKMWERRVEALREARERLPAAVRALDTWMYDDHEYALWLRRQREYWAKGDIAESQAELLRGIGAEPAEDGRVERRRRTWERNALRLLELHERSNLRGAEFFDSLKDPKLSAWLRQQSKRGASGEIRGDERRFLDALGFPWRPEQWAKKSLSTGRSPRKPRTAVAGFSSQSRSVWLPLLVEKLAAARAALPASLREHLETWRYAEVDDDGFQRRLWLLRRAMKSGKIDKESARVMREYRVATEVSRRRTLFEQQALELARIRESMEPDRRGRDFVALIPDKRIQTWVRNQPGAYRRGRFREDEIRFFNAINVPLEFKEGKRRAKVWWDFLAELEHVKRDYGTFAYPPEHPRHDAMERWKSAQRNARRRGKLEKERANRLEALGFSWDAWAEEEQRWEHSFEKLVAYKERFGNLDVPGDWTEDPDLGKWVAKQRAGLARPPMPRDRSTKLRRLGLKPADLPPVITRRWLDSVERLRTRLREDHGADKLVPDTELDATSRGFIVNQRRNRRQGRLTDKQIRILDDLGIDWNPPRKLTVPVRGPQPVSKKWMDQYHELKTLFEKHGPGALIDHRKAPRHLQFFATSQRMRRNRGQLTDEKIRLLDAIDFEWNPREKIRPAWMRRYEALKRFKEEHGTADVPRNYPPDQGLAEFIAQERQRARKGLLKPAQIKLLKEVGFRFETTPNRFKKGENPRKKRRKPLPGADAKD